MKKPRASVRQHPLFEELEPRILYSADAGALMSFDALSPSAEVRVLDYPSPSQGSVEQTAITTTTHEIVFVDTRVSNYQQLVDDLFASRDAARKIDMVLLDNSLDGIAQISEFLSQRHDIDAVHIISHGSDGSVALGSGQLNHDALLKNASIIKQWGNALTSEADILIYGCDVAQYADGKALVDELSRLTGADVAASDNLTGSATLGGDWKLEYQTNSIEANIAINAADQAQWQGVLVNAAPVLDNTKSPTLTAQNEDFGAPSGVVGTLVSSLVDFAAPAGQVDSVTDPDAGALLGIAVTAADTTNGNWWYSNNNGTNWAAMGAVANNSARLLAADANTRIYFQPDADYNGMQGHAITFRAWDQSTGVNGSLDDASINGGATAFSTAKDWASLAVNAVNDQPVRSNGTVSNLTVLENAPATSLGLAGVVYTHGGGNDENGQSLTYTVTAVPPAALGIITLSDGITPVTAGSSYSHGQLTTMKFLPTANANGGPAIFSWEVVDSGGTTNGGVDTLNESLTITITAVNDAPPASPILPLSLDLPPGMPTSGSTPPVLDTSSITQTPAPANVQNQGKMTVTLNPSGQTLSAHNQGAFVESIETLNLYRSPSTISFGTVANLDDPSINNTSHLPQSFDYTPVTFPVLEPAGLSALGISDIPAIGLQGLSNNYAALFNSLTPKTGARVENVEFVEPDISLNQEISQLFIENKVVISSAAISAGLLSWVAQYSAIFSSILATVPAWRNLDPVALLGRGDEDEPEWEGAEEECEENAEETAADIMSEKIRAHSSQDVV